MRRPFPKDILEKWGRLVDEDVANHLKLYQAHNPNASQFDLSYEEYSHRYLASFWNEPPSSFSDDEIRQWYGLPIKPQSEIEHEVLSSRHTGFTIGELINLPS